MLLLFPLIWVSLLVRVEDFGTCVLISNGDFIRYIVAGICFEWLRSIGCDDVMSDQNGCSLAM